MQADPDVDRWRVQDLSSRGFGLLVDELDEAIMIVTTMLTMKAVAPFREETQELLKALSGDTPHFISHHLPFFLFFFFSFKNISTMRR